MKTHIESISEDRAEGELARVYQEWFRDNPGRQAVPDILRCFSQRPDFLRDVNAISDRIHFSDGHLDYQTKERIATYASALNQCRYCKGMHATFLRQQGEDAEVVSALGCAHGDIAALSPADRELLRFVEILTTHSHLCTADDIQRLRDVGWSDPQMAEAVYVTALFAFFNRVANAFGLQMPRNDQFANPPESSEFTQGTPTPETDSEDRK
ncbi:MAG: peroxidase-related enzyme [Pirellulales bacterium]